MSHTPSNPNAQADPSQIDYDALAKQHGAISSVPAPRTPSGEIDYDALATKFGAVQGSPDVSAQAPSEDDAIEQFKREALSKTWDSLKSGDLEGAASSVASLFHNPNVTDQLPITKGVLKGAGQTVATSAKIANKVLPAPIARLMGVEPWVTPEMDNRLKLNSTGQKVGAGAEQLLEMSLAGGPIKKGVTAVASKLPWLARMAGPASRVASEAINTGGSAALHDQPVAQGAALGAAGAGVSEALSAAAPKIAESALGIRQAMRGGGKTIGKAVLDETSGVRPATIAKQASQKLSELTTELESRAAASGQQGTLATTAPAKAFLDGEIAKLQARNSPMAKKLMELKDQLTKNQYTGAMIPTNLPPNELLNLKRGVGDTIGTWEPSFKKTAEPIKRSVYRLIDAELDKTVPGAEELNQRISSLIPAKTQAGKIARSAPIGQRVAHRLAAHTGALTGATVGAALGYREGGLPKALEYGATGLLLPEAVASPTGQMLISRTATRGWPAILTRAGVTQLKKSKSNKQGEEE